jgi:hypothetical protein
MSSRERVWQGLTIASGLVGVAAAKRALWAGYRAARRGRGPSSPFDPTDAQFSWFDALLWGAVSGVGLGIARVMSTRLAAAGWKLATGDHPPGSVEQPSVV